MTVSYFILNIVLLSVSSIGDIDVDSKVSVYQTMGLCKIEQLRLEKVYNSNKKYNSMGISCIERKINNKVEN